MFMAKGFGISQTGSSSSVYWWAFFLTSCQATIVWNVNAGFSQRLCNHDPWNLHVDDIHWALHTLTDFFFFFKLELLTERKMPFMKVACIQLYSRYLFFLLHDFVGAEELFVLYVCSVLCLHWLYSAVKCFCWSHYEIFSVPELF